MNKVLKHLILGVLVLFGSGLLSAQSNDKTALQKDYNRIINEIKDIEDLLGKTKEQQQESLDQLVSIKRKINSRNSLINNIKEQANYLQNSIEEKKGVVAAMKSDLNELKSAYSQMVYNSYKNLHTKNKMSFIFSAESFNQALSRFNYLRTYSKYRENQAVLIDKTIVDIENKVALLEAEKIEKQALLDMEKQQSKVLEEEKAKEDQLFAKLQEDQDDLEKQAQDKNDAAQKLNDKIQDIIAEEIRLAKLKALENNPTPTATESIGLTPEEKLLSSDFVSNKGKLPWPVTKGYMIGSFGKQAHPTIPKVYTNNNGVDIKTEQGSEVRAVFSGTVVSSFYLPTTQNSVIVKHGEYYTVYSNLKNVLVKSGDNIVTKQTLGEVYTNESDQTTKVHLEVWQGTDKINPELWLVK